MASAGTVALKTLEGSAYVCNNTEPLAAADGTLLNSKCRASFKFDLPSVQSFSGAATRLQALGLCRAEG